MHVVASDSQGPASPYAQMACRASERHLKGVSGILRDVMAEEPSTSDLAQEFPVNAPAGAASAPHPARR